MGTNIRVLLADDHAVVRDGLRALLDSQSDIEVAGVAADGQEAVNRAEELRPDVVVMDISMPELGGIEAARRIVRRNPDIHVLILSMQGDPENVYRALQAGARGYLLKDSAGAELLDAVRTVSAGRRYLSEKINETVISGYLGEAGKRSPLESLSERERGLLKLLVEGTSNREAARILNLSVKTVETYKSRLMQKLGLDSLPALVRFAIEHGLSPK